MDASGLPAKNLAQQGWDRTERGVARNQGVPATTLRSGRIRSLLNGGIKCCSRQPAPPSNRPGSGCASRESYMLPRHTEQSVPSPSNDE